MDLLTAGGSPYQHAWLLPWGSGPQPNQPPAADHGQKRPDSSTRTLGGASEVVSLQTDRAMTRDWIRGAPWG